MKPQWRVDQFGVALAGSLDRYKSLVLDLHPDLVQVPLHLYQPSIECCEAVTKTGIKIIGKLVLPKGQNGTQAGRFEKLFTKYKGLITTWDFGGEPETERDEPGCRFNGTPSEFVDQMEEFYTIGKRIYSENTIGGCGWITPTFNGYFGNGDRSEFLKACLCLGIDKFLDFMSLNFYLYGYGGTKNILIGLSKIKELLAWNRVILPIVVSECGVPCDGNPEFLHIIQTPKRQAISLVEQNILFNSVGIDYSIWFALQYGGWGLVEESGEKRPSYHALQTMSTILKGATYLKQIKALPSTSVEERWMTDKVQWHVFWKDQKEVHVIWVTGAHHLLRERPENIQVIGLYGDELEGPGPILFRDAPKYIIAEPGALTQKTFFLR